MKVWQCDLNAKGEAPCITLHIRAEARDEACASVTTELETMLILLYPGELAEQSDAGFRFEDDEFVRMTRYIPRAAPSE